MCGALVGYCALERRRSVGAPRRAKGRSLGAAAALALVLASGSLAREGLPLDVVSKPSLLAYQAVLCLIAAVLSATLLGSGEGGADVTDLVVELGTARDRALPSTLADAIGDFGADVRDAMAERELELRAGTGLDAPLPTGDQVQLPGRHGSHVSDS